MSTNILVRHVYLSLEVADDRMPTKPGRHPIVVYGSARLRLYPAVMLAILRVATEEGSTQVRHPAQDTGLR